MDREEEEVERMKRRLQVGELVLIRLKAPTPSVLLAIDREEILLLQLEEVDLGEDSVRFWRNDSTPPSCSVNLRLPIRFPIQLDLQWVAFP